MRMKVMIILALVLLSAGCARPERAAVPDGKYETGQVLYIAMPADVGDYKNDYLERIPETGPATAEMLRQAFAPYTSQILMGAEYGEDDDAAVAHATAAGARYSVHVTLGSYYRKAMLWQSSLAGLVLFLNMTDLEQMTNSRRVALPLFSERGTDIPVDRIMREDLPDTLLRLTKYLFDPNAENKASVFRR